MEITIKNLQKRIPLCPRHLTKTIKIVLRHEKIKKSFLSFVFVDDQRIKMLNKKYLETNHATDVLAFDLSEGPTAGGSFRKANKLCGEIIISTDTVTRHARIFKTTHQQELTLCVIHGILHLLGYDDHGASQIRKMRQKEAQLLALTFKK